MFTDPVQFYFVKTGAHGPLSDDLQTITDQLGTYASDGIGIKRDAVSLTIFFDESPMKSVLTIDKNPKLSDTIISNQMVLTCEKQDNLSVNLLRNIIRNMGYRVYNPTLGCYNSLDPDLLDLTTFSLDSKVRKIITDNGFMPLFNYRNNLIYFAQSKKDTSIYQINSDILLHLIEKGVSKFEKQDFAIKVASDLGHFIALYDRGIIQGGFYDKGREIVNHSGFDNKLKRDVYVRTVFFEYNGERQSFEQLKGGVMKRDLLKKGSNLKTYPKKILKDLKISNKFLIAKIKRSIDFEENQGALIPRLNMVIFVD